MTRRASALPRHARPFAPRPRGVAAAAVAIASLLSLAACKDDDAGPLTPAGAALVASAPAVAATKVPPPPVLAAASAAPSPATWPSSTRSSTPCSPRRRPAAPTRNAVRSRWAPGPAAARPAIARIRATAPRRTAWKRWRSTSASSRPSRRGRRIACRPASCRPTPVRAASRTSASRAAPGPDHRRVTKRRGPARARGFFSLATSAARRIRPRLTQSRSSACR